MPSPDFRDGHEATRVLTFLGGAVVAWPLAARAQQPRMRRIGVLNVASAQIVRPNVAFRQGLIEIGDRRPQCRDRISLD